ncbi:MAG: 4-alpha-glucanotransferase [Salinivirgaceae bacterium]|nr:4-alpha-glucanotransferase [Salinivirgaceae bacterium]
MTKKMNIEFNIQYKTYFGEVLIISGKCPELGDSSLEKAPKMVLIDPERGLWKCNILFPNNTCSIEYKYYVKGENELIEEWGSFREFEPINQSAYSLHDAWRTASNPQYALFSKAIGETIFNYKSRFKPEEKESSGNVRFRISVPRIKNGQRLAISGNIAELGNWDFTKAIPMSNTNHPIWEIEIVTKGYDYPIEYKYCVIEAETQNLVFVEEGVNRFTSAPIANQPNVSIIITDELFRYPTKPWKGAGVAIPLFSLRSKNSFGIGEYPDIKLMVDWVIKANLKIIQLLPINDTTATHSWLDSYPYSGISVYALHPIYINLHKMGSLKSKSTQHSIDAEGKLLNDLETLDYEAVLTLKWKFFKQQFDQQKELFHKEERYQHFFDANKEWLPAYAAFCYLRDRYQTADFNRWEKYAHFSPQIIDELCNPNFAHYQDIAIHYFLQYHAHQQLLDAAQYAQKSGVALKGDIPIGIYRHSVDAWVAPQLYNMSSQTGAPPDDFSTIGQNWRFPTYNWEIMKKNNYHWWQNRLQKMSTYFDAFRIDHILGFFRIWEIPANQVQGLLGRFNPSIPLSQEEITDKGIVFDHNRLCKPYICMPMLKKTFGKETKEVIDTFLEELVPRQFTLKEAFDTQEKIVTAFYSESSPIPEKLKNDSIKDGLYALVAEVIFLDAPDGNNRWYVPRYSFQSTYSFKNLPENQQTILNELYHHYFFQRNEQFWAANALKKLPVIKNATQMLLCGEDLGMVPKCVPKVMEQLGILSLEIQRMPKEDWVAFGDTSKYPYLSVATPSSHDTSTIRGWWKENPVLTQKFNRIVLNNIEKRSLDCGPKIVKQIIEQHLESPSMLAIFALQDLLGISKKLRFNNVEAERINDPSNSKNYWRYRMHLDLETLLEEHSFTSEVKTMIIDSSRDCVY